MVQRQDERGVPPGPQRLLLSRGRAVDSVLRRRARPARGVLARSFWPALFARLRQPFAARRALAVQLCRRGFDRGRVQLTVVLLCYNPRVASAARLMSFLTRLTEPRPILLDGATGSELTRRAVDTGLPLWSARALVSAP